MVFFLILTFSPSLLQGMPDWEQIVKELPPMEALLSKLERWHFLFSCLLSPLLFSFSFSWIISVLMPDLTCKLFAYCVSWVYQFLYFQCKKRWMVDRCVWSHSMYKNYVHGTGMDVMNRHVRFCVRIFAAVRIGNEMHRVIYSINLESKHLVRSPTEAKG